LITPIGAYCSKLQYQAAMSNSEGDVNNGIAPPTSNATAQPAPPTTPRANGEPAQSPDIKSPTLATPAERSERETVNISSKDVDFLIACLQHTTGGSITIDIQRVAEAKGFKNPRSVSNKILQLKKQYDLPFNTSAKGAATNQGPTTPKPRKPRAPKESPATMNGNSLLTAEPVTRPVEMTHAPSTTPRPNVPASHPFSPINGITQKPQSPTRVSNSTPASRQLISNTQHINGFHSPTKRASDGPTYAWNATAPRDPHGETESDRSVKRVKIEPENGPTPAFGRSPLPDGAGSTQPRAIPNKETVVKHEFAPEEGSAIKREPLPEPEGIAV
jgi:hypothetical protein